MSPFKQTGCRHWGLCILVTLMKMEYNTLEAQNKRKRLAVVKCKITEGGYMMMKQNTI